MYKIQIRRAQQTQSFSATKISRLLQYKDIIAVMKSIKNHKFDLKTRRTKN
jgi:hypothetical protein